jgi:hypothetical protein
MEMFDKRIQELTVKDWFGECVKAYIEKHDTSGEFKDWYIKAFALVGLLFVASLAFALRYRRELQILETWKRHVIDNEWSELSGEDLTGVTSEESKQSNEGGIERTNKLKSN